jgi:hypothetical protein
MPAALGPDLILDRDRRKSRLFEGTYDEMDIERIAVTGIGIGQQGN